VGRQVASSSKSDPFTEGRFLESRQPALSLAQ
jgi:hypothetical protein